jgi:hypothetical protein
MNGLHERDAVAGMIQSGKQLLLAGDESLLGSLPRGRWIGGTIPYFMAEHGGTHTTDRIYVTELPQDGKALIRSYDVANLSSLAKDHTGHGFTVLLLPAFSDTHLAYAQNASGFPGIFDRPVVGWVSGVALDDIGRVSPKVFDGPARRAQPTRSRCTWGSRPNSTPPSIS